MIKGPKPAPQWFEVRTPEAPTMEVKTERRADSWVTTYTWPGRKLYRMPK